MARMMLKKPHVLLQYGEVFFDAAFESHAVALSAREGRPMLSSLSEARAPSAKPNSEYQDRPRCAFAGCSYYGTAAQSGYCSVHFKQTGARVSAAAAPSTMMAQASAPAQEQVMETPAAGMASAPSIHKPDVESDATDAAATAVHPPATAPPAADDGTVLVSLPTTLAFGVKKQMHSCNNSLPQRDGRYLYMTLHKRKVNDDNIRPFIEAGEEPLEIPQGWNIAVGDADDVRVCGTHAWQSDFLVFRNGASYGTLANVQPSRIGDCTYCGHIIMTLTKDQERKISRWTTLL